MYVKYGPVIVAVENQTANGPLVTKSGRIPDLVLRILVDGKLTDVILDVKYWRLSTLLRVGPNSPAVRLGQQVSDLLSEDDMAPVILEYVQTKTNPITSAQQVYSVLAARGVDISRVVVRVIGRFDSVVTGL
jgi:hypothetical protein